MLVNKTNIGERNINASCATNQGGRNMQGPCYPQSGEKTDIADR